MFLLDEFGLVAACVRRRRVLDALCPRPIAPAYDRYRKGQTAKTARAVATRAITAARRGSDAPPLLLKAVRELEAVDPALARATYLDALAAALFAGRLARGASALEVAQAVLGLPPSHSLRTRGICSCAGWRC
jgi:hypothetical protein